MQALREGSRDRLTYHLGLFLATNAIRDAVTVIDGPDCIFRKTQWVHGKHDWSSTLLDALGEHRVANTLLSADRVVNDRGDVLAARLRKVAGLGSASAVLVCSMPHVTIIGTQYDRILRGLEPELGVPLFEVPSRSLEGDWLDGYEEALTALARGLDIRGRSPRPGHVAFIGHLMDRVEQDQLANVAELRRMAEALGLTVTSIWLDGGGFADLAGAADAELLVAFPLGKPAASALAQRTGARVIHCDVPFGAGRTERLLLALGRATGRLDRAEAFVEAELARLTPRLEWVVPHVFVGRRVAYWGPPFMFGGFLQLTAEVGLEAVYLGSSTSDRLLDPDLAEEFSPLPPIQCDPTNGEMESALHPGPAGLDLVIGDTLFLRKASRFGAVLELGFPAHFSHALSPRPHLGFEGWMCFLDRMAQAMTQTVWSPRPRHGTQVAGDKPAYE